MIAAFRPGIAMYDTVAQYGQVLSGDYTDWHPPVMARLWSLLAPLGRGAAPMLALQVALYWLGLGLIAAALRAIDRPNTGWAMLAIGLFPPFVGWQAVVLKDAQLVGAALAATGIVAWWRLRGQRLPRGAVVLVAVLFGYALLVRANAVFAMAPLIAGILPLSRPWKRVAAVVGLTIVTIALSGPVNHRLLGGAATGVEKTQPLYDIAGIATRVDDPAATGLPRDRANSLRERHCVTPFFWDPLGDGDECEAIVASLHAQPSAGLYRTLARAALAHPLAYSEQRAAHWNVTERWLVPSRLPSAAPPASSERNDVGLASPGRIAAGWQAVASALIETPLGWPICWLALAIGLLPVAVRAPLSPTRHLALALLASAVCLEGSFAAISIAADLRYHLWPMLATALAATLLAPPPRACRLAFAMVSIAIGTGAAARTALPAAPASYDAMLHWPCLPGTPHQSIADLFRADALCRG